MLNKLMNKFLSFLDCYINAKENLSKIEKIKSIPKQKINSNELLKNTIILIHTGKRPIPKYAKYCIEQIRLMDSNIPIYFVCSKEIDTSILPHYCNIVFEEDVAPSEEHVEFLMKCVKKRIGRFFQVTIERFFILYDVMQSIGVKNVIHLENDNLLYINATELLTNLEKYYSKIATPRSMNDVSCPSIMYVPSIDSLKDFLNFINHDSDNVYFNDMALLPSCVDAGRADSLPTLTKRYFELNGLVTVLGKRANKNELSNQYYLHSNELGGIFDCASLGQYLDGCDRTAHPNKKAGYINKFSYVDPRKLRVNWIKGEDNLFRPFYIENGEKYLIFNLHIHSKNLKSFQSNARFI